VLISPKTWKNLKLAQKNIAIKMNKFNRIYLSIFLYLSFFSFEGFSQDGEAVMMQQFPSEKISLLEVSSGGASIVVNTTREDKIAVELFAIKGGITQDPTDSNVKKKLEEFEIDIKQEDRKVIVLIRNIKKSGSKLGRDDISLKLKIAAPQQMSTQISTFGGTITLSGLQSDQKLESGGGSIRLFDCAGSLKVSSAGGNFSMDDFEGLLDLNTGGGSVKIEKFSGEMNIDSSGGSATLFDIKAKVALRSSGGGIQSNFSDVKEEISLVSSGGNISVVFPKQLPMDILLKGSNVISQHDNFEGDSKKSQVIGKINGGGVAVKVEAGSGKVRVDYF
jgi:hypothetical protein